jgi:transposase
MPESAFDAPRARVHAAAMNNRDSSSDTQGHPDHTGYLQIDPEVLEHRRRRVRELTEGGKSLGYIAAELGITRRSVSRYRARLGTPAPETALRPKALTPELDELVRRMRADGVPTTWVADTVPGMTPDQARRYPMGRENQLEWQRAWAAIRRNPTLRALHYEFAPKPLRTRQAEKATAA